MRALTAYRLRRNCLYKEGYAEALLGGAPSRLLAIEELELIDRFLWDLGFGASSLQKFLYSRPWDPVSITQEFSYN